MRVRPTRFLSALMTSALLVTPFVSTAQTVPLQKIMIRLESADGTVTLQGRLIGIENGFYVLETAGSNTVMVQADRINCVSALCPL